MAARQQWKKIAAVIAFLLALVYLFSSSEDAGVVNVNPAAAAAAKTPRKFKLPVKATAASIPLNVVLGGDAYLAENAHAAGVVVTASGLQYKILHSGPATGLMPRYTDTISCHYHGQNIDLSVFDSSYDKNKPITLAVNNVIPGWTEALQLMHVGDVWQLTLPGELGYGVGGSGKLILPNAVLLFKVELIAIINRTE